MRNSFMLLQKLPLGEWNCPNCTCKFCGIASGLSEKDDASVPIVHTCNLCEKKCIHFLSFIFLLFLQYFYILLGITLLLFCFSL